MVLAIFTFRAKTEQVQAWADSGCPIPADTVLAGIPVPKYLKIYITSCRMLTLFTDEEVVELLGRIADKEQMAAGATYQTTVSQLVRRLRLEESS